MARPRGFLARALYDKYHNDQYIENFDMSKWYSCEKSTMVEKYQHKFINLEEPDDITMAWLQQSKEKSSDLWLQIWHIIAKLFLKLFLTQTDVNGFLNRGSMYILSEKQFSQLLTFGGFQNSFGNETTILDIGAGDGEVTMRLAKSVIQQGNNMLKVYATESSYIMQDRLRDRHFTVINSINDISDVHLISCLNVLDRCINPKSLLTDMYHALHPNGRILLALVLPYSHYVEKNTHNLPVQPLLPHGPTCQSPPFEVESAAFFDELEKIGFKIESWTKAPYLCEGDLRQSFYFLTDVLVVVSK